MVKKINVLLIIVGLALSHVKNSEAYPSDKQFGTYVAKAVFFKWKPGKKKSSSADDQLKKDDASFQQKHDKRDANHQKKHATHHAHD